MAVTSTSSWAPNIPTEVIDRLVLDGLRNAIVVSGRVRRKDLTGIPGLKADFNSFGLLTAAAKTQGTDYTPAALTIGEDGTVTCDEVGVVVQIPMLNAEANPFVSADDVARQLANAVAAKMETDVLASITSAGTTKGTSGAQLSVTDIEDALLALRQAKAPAAPVADSNLPPAFAGYFGMFAEAGIAQLERSIRQAGGGLSNPSFQTMLETFGAAAAGAVRFRYLGVDFYGSDLVPTTSSDRNGAILCPAAIGIATKGVPQILSQDWVKGTETHTAGRAVYGTGLIKDAFIVEVLHSATMA